MKAFVTVEISTITNSTQKQVWMIHMEAHQSAAKTDTMTPEAALLRKEVSKGPISGATSEGEFLC